MSIPKVVRRSPLGLLCLNAILLVALGVVTFAPNAIGQFQPKSNTLAISAASGISKEQLLWMFHPQSMEMVVVGWDRTGKSMIPLDYRNVAEDVELLKRSR
tara:strand:- start:1795 stop:2097 length:303 start_codon:yes stop_codon:yes gene_type:complete